MPLMAKLPTAMGEHDPAVVQVQLEAQPRPKIDLISEEKEREEQQDSGYEDFDLDEEPEDSDMEGSFMHRPRPKKPAKPPAIPQRSDKRASKILENAFLELKSLDGTVSAKKDVEQQSIVTSSHQSDPHELYLSSEEDASLSDDCEDTESLVDFAASPTEDGEDSKPSSRASSRKSQEDTARVVSFTIVKKSEIIQIRIPPTTSSQNRHSTNLETLTSQLTKSESSYVARRRPTLLKLYPSSTPRLSISSGSTSLTQHSNHSLTSLPPRKSSKLSNLSSLMTTAKNSFLASDPFATQYPQKEEDEETPVTPKTPTSIATAAWKKTLSRGIGRARKPSMPKLSLAYTAGVVSHRDSKLAMELAAEEIREYDREKEARASVERLQTMPLQAGAGEEKVRYEDIIKRAGEVIKAPQPSSPVKDRKMSMSWGLARKKSVKGRGDRYTE
jgi:hypothetical protein